MHCNANVTATASRYLLQEQALNKFDDIEFVILFKSMPMSKVQTSRARKCVQILSISSPNKRSKQAVVSCLPLMLELHTPQRPQRHCSPNNALVHLVTDAHFPARLSRRKSILHAPISISKKRAAHLHCTEAIDSNASLCHPKILNASHATHARHGYATR